MSKPFEIDYHGDAELFLSAIQFTSAKTQFSARLIEKDYYCSVMLIDLCAINNFGLVFKGGTCLSKIHADFFRLSEDLDFSISMPENSKRSQRSRKIAPIKKHLENVAVRHPALRIDKKLKGFNNSTQYGGQVAYQSVITGQDGFIKIEISVRETIIEPTKSLDTRTLLLDPFRNTTAVQTFPSPALSQREAYAEKMRASLTRQEPAIRDFFDLDHAISTGKIEITDSQLIELLRKKLAVSGNGPVDMSLKKIECLRSEVATHLKPVLRATDLALFDLDRVVEQISYVAQIVSS